MFENFIQSYGYYAVFLFACIEGEIAVLTAGFFCKQGLLSLDLVILFAFLGTLITEQGLFFVGKIYGIQLLENHPKIFKKSKNAIEFLRKYDSAFIFCSRFVYGIRNISPIIIGAAGISPLKFSTLNIPAALIWSITVSSAGYLFADALNSAKGHMKIVQFFALIVFASLFCYFFYKRKKRKKLKQSNSGH